jgi:tRNA nucleotidyltransferase/poly(A) polymerase
LLEKVSYERLGTELDKMFEGSRTKLAVQLMHDFDILPLLYKLPEEAQQLHDQALVSSLIAESVRMCHKLSDLFDQFKCQLEVDNRATFAGITVSDNA